MGKPLPANVGATGVIGPLDVANAVVLGTFTAIGPGLPFDFYGPFNLAIYNEIDTNITTTARSTSAVVVSGTGLAVGDAIRSSLVPPGATIKTLSGTSLTLGIPAINILSVFSTFSENVVVNGDTSTLLNASVSGIGIAGSTTVTAIVQPYIASNGVVPATPGIITISNLPIGNSGKQLNGNVGTVLTFVPTGPATSGTATASFFGSAINYVGSVQLERSFDGGNTWIVCGIGGSGAQAIWSTGTPVSVVVGEPERGVAYRLNCTAYTSGTINWRMSASGAAAMSLSVASAI